VLTTGLLTNAKLAAAVLASNVLAFAMLATAVLASAVLASAVLASAMLASAVLASAVLASAVLASAMLASAVLASAVLASAMLASAVLTTAMLTTAMLTTAMLTTAMLPATVAQVDPPHIVGRPHIVCLDRVEQLVGRRRTPQTQRVEGRPLKRGRSLGRERRVDWHVGEGRGPGSFEAEQQPGRGHWRRLRRRCHGGAAESVRLPVRLVEGEGILLLLSSIRPQHHPVPLLGDLCQFPLDLFHFLVDGLDPLGERGRLHLVHADQIESLTTLKGEALEVGLEAAEHVREELEDLGLEVGTDGNLVHGLGAANWTAG
jgi:hypothetical protein